MIGRLLASALDRWDALDAPTRRQAFAVLLCGALYLVHFAWYSHWYIEDAAISFAFARHLAEGDGFVAYPGGEPVEGFSNPTWTLALAALHLVGIGPFVGAKLLGAVLGLLGLPLAWRWARALLPGRRDLGPALAPLLLALSPQYVAWAASGLENSIVTVTMAGGGAALMGEVASRRRLPWSAVWFSVLAISRPEAPAYVFVAGLAGFLGVAGRQGLRGALDWAWRWSLLAIGPFVAWQAFRFLHFAWEAPNTYYAKLHDDDRFRPWVWSGRRARGWGYLRGYALNHAHGFLLWLYVIGQTGWQRGRLWLGLALSVALYLLLLPGIVWLWDLWGEAPLLDLVPALGEGGALPVWPFAPDPAWWVTARVAGLGVLVAVLPLLGAGREGQAGRLLAAWLTGFVVFFALYAGGDWMDGYRWLNLCSVPLAVLLADASVRLYDKAYAWLPGVRLPWLALLPAAVVAVLSVVHTVDRIRGPETSPYDVYRRVAYLQAVADRLDRPLDTLTWMDVDMGAHVWWAARDSAIVDMAGLVDVPLGHHKWERPFVAQYVYEERQPDFAHVHGSWAGRTKMRSHRGWRDYVEVDPFPVSVWRVHEGNHVHERHLLLDAWPHGPGRRVRFDGGLVLAGWRLPVPVAVPGGTVQVEVGWERSGVLRRSPRVLVVLAQGERVVTRELPLAYGWLAPDKWPRRQVIRGDHRLTLPEDLPAGAWDVGFVVLDDDGVRPVLGAPTGATTEDPVLARGEVRWTGLLTIADEAALDASADEALQAVLEGEDCATREAAWDDARHHRPPDHRWRRGALARVRPALALCWSRALVDGVEEGLPRQEIVARGRAARRWDHRHPDVARVTAELADRWMQASREAEARGDLPEAYALARDALGLRPYDAWGRRRAERLRDAVLRIETTPPPSEPLARWLGWG